MTCLLKWAVKYVPSVWSLQWPWCHKTGSESQFGSAQCASSGLTSYWPWCHKTCKKGFLPCIEQWSMLLQFGLSNGHEATKLAVKGYSPVCLTHLNFPTSTLAFVSTYTITSYSASPFFPPIYSSNSTSTNYPPQSIQTLLVLCLWASQYAWGDWRTVLSSKTYLVQTWYQLW